MEFKFFFFLGAGTTGISIVFSTNRVVLNCHAHMHKQKDCPKTVFFFGELTFKGIHSKIKMTHLIVPVVLVVS